MKDLPKYIARSPQCAMKDLDLTGRDSSHWSWKPKGSPLEQAITGGVRCEISIIIAGLLQEGGI